MAECHAAVLERQGFMHAFNDCQQLLLPYQYFLLFAALPELHFWCLEPSVSHGERWRTVAESTRQLRSGPSEDRVRRWAQRLQHRDSKVFSKAVL